MNLAQYHLSENTHSTFHSLLTHPDERPLLELIAQLRGSPVDYSLDICSFRGMFGGSGKPSVTRPEFRKRIILLSRNFDIVTSVRNTALQSRFRNIMPEDNAKLFRSVMLEILWNEFEPSRLWETAFMDFWAQSCHGEKFSFAGKSKPACRFTSLAADNLSGWHVETADRMAWMLTHGFPFEKSYNGQTGKFSEPRIILGKGAVKLDDGSTLARALRKTRRSKALFDWLATRDDRDLLITNHALIELDLHPLPRDKFHSLVPLFRLLSSPVTLVAALQAYISAFPNIEGGRGDGPRISKRELDSVATLFLQSLDSAKPGHACVQEAIDACVARRTIEALQGK